MMKMKFSFTVTANCVSQKLNDEYGKPIEKEIDIEFDEEKSQKVLFRFAPDTFEISDGIKIIFMTKQCVILVMKNDDAYIIKNTEQFFRDIHEGYSRLLAFNKFCSILEFDFDAGIEFQN